jgi:hypothetical protein
VQAFKRAVEEAVEIRDRRAGQTPRTQHEPLDFLLEKPEYDASLVTMSFDEMFPPLSDTDAAAADSAAALAALRSQARNPCKEHAAMREAERLLVWCRFHHAPLSVRKKMAAAHAGAPRTFSDMRQGHKCLLGRYHIRKPDPINEECWSCHLHAPALLTMSGKGSVLKHPASAVIVRRFQTVQSLRVVGRWLRVLEAPC